MCLNVPKYARSWLNIAECLNKLLCSGYAKVLNILKVFIILDIWQDFDYASIIEYSTQGQI